MAEMNGSTTRPTATGWRVGVDRAYTYLMTLFFVAVLVQVFLAGVGVFGDHAKKVEDASSFDPHRALGSILGGIAVILLIVALIAHISRATMIWAFVLAALAFAAQPGLASGGNSNKWVGGLHALDGMFILMISGYLTGVAHRRVASRRRLPQPEAAVST